MEKLYLANHDGTLCIPVVTTVEGGKHTAHSELTNNGYAMYVNILHIRHYGFPTEAEAVVERIKDAEKYCWVYPQHIGEGSTLYKPEDIKGSNDWNEAVYISINGAMIKTTRYVLEDRLHALETTINGILEQIGEEGTVSQKTQDESNSDTMNVVFSDKLFFEEFGEPAYATDGSAGLDIRACIANDMVLEPNGCILIDTGMKIQLTNKNHAAVLLPRSGIGHKQGIVLGNLVGLIDFDYRGPVMVSLWNRSQEPFTIKRGDRIAQMVVIPVITPRLNVVTELVATKRGENGLGSTGVK